MVFLANSHICASKKNSSFVSYFYRINLYSPAKQSASCFNKQRTPLARGRTVARRKHRQIAAVCTTVAPGFLFFFFHKVTRVSAFIHFAAIMFFFHPPDEMSPTNDSIYRAFRTPLQLLKVASSNFPWKKSNKKKAGLRAKHHFLPDRLLNSAALFSFQMCCMTEKPFSICKHISTP